ncbi:MAG: bis-aminopropyl spermidine synthase family protein [Crenarchaeota archaeon]|nr:bis-aminopropyl spermidine synthase family protein [Thermoproteota archaeon]MCR8471135.1 bis-aminopropyl spermidine synthase family protein [Thermoproteota archaeon]
MTREKAYDLLLEIAKNAEKKTGIPAYPRSVLNVMSAAALSNNVFWVARYSREAFNLLIEILKELEKRNLVNLQAGVELTEEGKKLLQDVGYEIKFRICDHCKGRTILFDEILDKDVVREFIKIQENRPPAIQEFDQGFVTSETTLARVAYMYYRGDLRNRDIIILGDDDLLSIAVGLTNLANRIVVIDIDKRLTEFIQRVSNEYGLRIEVYTEDLRRPLPEDLCRKFDVFQTDPLESLNGFKVFVGRGIAALRGERCAGYFYLTLVDASIDKWREIQRLLLTEFNVVITDIIPDFSEYVNWNLYFEEMQAWKILPESLRQIPRDGWYVSTLFRIETLRGSRGLFETISSEENIYYDKELASA